MYICICVNMAVHAHEYMDVCIFVSMYCVCMSVFCLFMNVYIDVDACVYLPMCIHTKRHMFMHTYILGTCMHIESIEFFYIIVITNPIMTILKYYFYNYWCYFHISTI